jgi:hypothetical protein
VLANISLVWRTALESGFREGRDANLSILDADPDPGVVEAVLKYAYTGELHCDTPEVALRIAHSCEMSELVALCPRCMLDDVTIDLPSTLRPKSDKDTKPTTRFTPACQWCR